MLGDETCAAGQERVLLFERSYLFFDGIGGAVQGGTVGVEGIRLV